MVELPAIFYIAFAAACIITGLSKGGFGGTLGSISTPLLSLVIPANAAVGLMLPVLMLADIFAVAAYWRKWDGTVIRSLLPAAIAGIAVGSLFVSIAPIRVLKVTLGIVTLVFAAYRVFEGRLVRNRPYAHRPWHGRLAGGAAGFLSALANAGGPPAAIYMLLLKINPREFVATSAIFFAIVNLIKAPFFFIGGVFRFDLLASAWWLLPLLPLSVWAGRRLAPRINRMVFERLILVFLVITAVLLVAG